MDFQFIPVTFLISKQEDDSTIRAVGYNRCVTGRKPCDESHMVRFGQSADNCSRVRDMQPISLSPTSLQGGASVGTPWLLVEDMGRSPLSEYMSLHLSLKQHQTVGPFQE